MDYYEIFKKIYHVSKMNKSGDLGFEKCKFQYHKIQVEKKKKKERNILLVIT